MATTEQLQRAASMIRQVQERTVVCEQVAQALIEVGREWIPKSRLFRTDYHVAQDAVVEAAQRARQLVDDLKRRELNADLIRADAALERVLMCCRKCATVNAGRVRKGELFQCQMRAQEQPVTLRFNLNGEGLILERR